MSQKIERIDNTQLGKLLETARNEAAAINLKKTFHLMEMFRESHQVSLVDCSKDFRDISKYGDMNKTVIFYGVYTGILEGELVIRWTEGARSSGVYLRHAQYDTEDYKEFFISAKCEACKYYFNINAIILDTPVFGKSPQSIFDGFRITDIMAVLYRAWRDLGEREESTDSSHS